MVAANEASNIGWSNETTHVVVKYDNSTKELKIRPERPNPELDKLNGVLKLDDYTKYEISQDDADGEIDLGNYYYNARGDIYLTNALDERAEYHLRYKATGDMLPSEDYIVERTAGIVQYVSDLNEGTSEPLVNGAYRELGVKVTFDDSSLRVLDILSTNLTDKYITRDNTGTTIDAENFNIEVGDAVSVYQINNDAVEISDVVLSAKNVPTFTVDDGMLNLKSQYI